jgi:hypothetical protein
MSFEQWVVSNQILLKNILQADLITDKHSLFVIDVILFKKGIAWQ